MSTPSAEPDPQAASAAVTRHFAGVAQPLSMPLPEVAAGVTVLFAPFSSDDGLTTACAAVLSDAEQQRSERLATPEVRRSFLQRRAFRRYAASLVTGCGDLSTLDFAVHAKGRPWLPTTPAVSWSVSSCRSGMLVAWSEVFEIGVDVEDRARQADCMALAQRYFASEEKQLVATATEATRMTAFLRLWCLKEAVLKGIGEGIAFGLDRFVFTLDPEVRLVAAPADWGGPEAFQACELSGASLADAAATAAVVVRHRPPAASLQSHSAGP